MQKYTYNGETYYSEWALRQAIYAKERKAFSEAPKENADAFWASLGVKVEGYVPELTDEQLATRARQERDLFLSECDYYVMPDYPSTEEGLAAVKAYRQALRDITSQAEFPRGIDWPVKPAVLGGADEQ